MAQADHGNLLTSIPGNSFPKHRTKVSLSTEWPLLAFTLMASILVALFHSWILAALPLNVTAFALVGAVAMGLSTAHLGRKLRFYRAILNWRRSWVSREVALFSAFFGGAIYVLAFAPDDALLARAVSALGFAALFAMDKVYQIDTNLSSKRLHSASVLLTGIYWVGLFTMLPYFLFPLGLGKLVLYVLRGGPKLLQERRQRQVLSSARMLFGFVIPVGLWLGTGTTHYGFIIASIGMGEVLDRTEFYLDLDFTRPAVHAQKDLEKMATHKPLVLT